MSNNEMITVPQWDLQHPAANYRMATDVAGLCREIVVKTAISIQGKQYVRAEGWQAIATAHGCVASARDVEQIEGGVRAIGEVRKVSDGVVIATAEGFVGDDETMWAKRPMYARRAMCQTRAISRACRSAFAHVVVLMDAGLSTTPAEEVPAEGFDNDRINAREAEREDKARAASRKVDPKNYKLRPNQAPRGGDGGFPANPLDNSDSLPTERSDETGAWLDVVVHFGKNKGIRLGDLEPQTLRWYQKEWQPRPFNGRISDQDKALRAALDSSMGKVPDAKPPVEEELETVPF